MHDKHVELHNTTLSGRYLRSLFRGYSLLANLTIVEIKLVAPIILQENAGNCWLCCYSDFPTIVCIYLMSI